MLKDNVELFLPLRENITNSLQKKIEKIAQFMDESPDDVLIEEDKLTATDFHFLMMVPLMKMLLESFSSHQIPCPHFQELYFQWSEIEKLNQGKVTQRLRKLCFSGLSLGRVAFFDWSSRKVHASRPLEFYRTIIHVFGDRIIHAGIIVRTNQNKPALSHVGAQSKNHSLLPYNPEFPMTAAFCNYVDLDISPLISDNVSQEHKLLLQKHFLDSFLQFASIEHPEVRFAEFKILIFTFFFGHKSFKSQELSEVDLKSETSQVCASYVGIIFLKAVHNVNVKLTELGYTEKIEHPFGRHEAIERIDNLRLLYHLNRLKIMKVTPIDPLVSKVVVTYPLIKST